MAGRVCSEDSRAQGKRGRGAAGPSAPLRPSYQALSPSAGVPVDPEFADRIRSARLRPGSKEGMSMKRSGVLCGVLAVLLFLAVAVAGSLPAGAQPAPPAAAPPAGVVLPADPAVPPPPTLAAQPKPV